MKSFLKDKLNPRLGVMALLALFGSGKLHAQTSITHVAGVVSVVTGQTLEWYGNVEIEDNTQLYLEDNGKIYFYGNKLTVGNNVTINGTPASWSSFTAGTGNKTIVFYQPNPNDNSSVQQTLIGANNGSTTNNTLLGIEINNALGVKLSGSDTRIGDHVTFINGHIYTDVNHLILSSAATINGADQNKFVVTATTGTLAKEGLTNSNFAFPVGSSDVAGDYLPAIMNNTGLADRYDVRAIGSLTPAPANGSTSMLTRSWQITEAVAGGSNVFLALQNDPSVKGAAYTDASASILTSPATAAWKVASTSSPSYGPGTVTNSIVHSVAGVSDFSTNTYFTKGTLSSGVMVSVKALLQGAVSGSTMTTSLNTLGVIPKTQPYNVAPFNYAGTESVASIPAGVTDWVLVELHDKTTPTTVVATRAAFVKNDGTVVDMDGASPVSFTTASPDNYYVAIRHRNHLAIRTAAAQTLSSAATLYDFTSGQAKAYQNTSITANAAMRDMGNGLFAMWGGDGNSNGKVSYSGPNNDESYLNSTALGGVLTTVLSPVYNNADYNMNGKVSYNGPNNDESFLNSNVLGQVLTLIVNQHL